MTDEQRLLELIDGDLDGRLDSAEKAELARLLLADPPARRLHEELRGTEALLRRIPQVEPPAGLRSSIQAALGLSDHNRGGRRAADGGVGYRLAAAVVAGLVIVGLGYGLLSERKDTTALQGSIAAGAIPVVTLRAGDGQVVVRVEEAGKDNTRLVLSRTGDATGDVDVVLAAQGPVCRGVGDDDGPAPSSPDGMILALPEGGATADLECTGTGSVRLETRLDGARQDTATLKLGH